MSVKQWPADFIVDGTNTATKVIGANPDGTPVYVTRPAGGETFQSVTDRAAITTQDIIIGSMFSSKNATNDRQIQILSALAIPRIQSANLSGSTAKDIAINPVGGNVMIGPGSPTAKLDVGGNGNFSGSVSATVFNPTSLRDRKRDIEDYTGDALAEINNLQLHTYHFREYESVEKTPAVYEEVTDGEGNVTQVLVTIAEYEQVEKQEISQMLNVGVILDEVDNPLVADQEKGCLNLNNIVFLQAKAIQQLLARIEALEAK